MAEYLTVETAENLDKAASDGKWRLADAVLHDTKQQTTDTEVLAVLKNIADALADAGIATPSGDPYVVSSLVALRRTALAWPPADRHDLAAIRTHQEAGLPGSLGRLALAALAQVAAGETVECPTGIDEDAWAAAVARVTKRLAARRRPRYLIAANDVRVAIQRRPNIPTARPVERSQMAEMLCEVSDATAALGAFARRFTKADPSQEDRESLAAALRRLLARAQATLEVVETDAFTDGDFEELLKGADDGRV